MPLYFCFSVYILAIFMISFPWPYIAFAGACIVAKVCMGAEAVCADTGAVCAGAKG